MLLSRKMWVSSRYECSLSTNKVIHIQGSGGHCRCHYDSLHVEQLPFFSRFSGKHEEVVERETRAFPVARDSLSTYGSRSPEKAHKKNPIL